MNSKVYIVCAVILCPFVKGAQEEMLAELRARLEKLVICPTEDKFPKNSGMTLSSSEETFKNREQIKARMIEEMLRMPSKFYDAIDLTQIYFVDTIASTLQPDNVLGGTMSTWDHKHYISFSTGYEHTLFHELGHAMDRVRIYGISGNKNNCKDHDPQWMDFGKQTCKAVGQPQVKYINKLTPEGWQCMPNKDSGKWPANMWLDATRGGRSGLDTRKNKKLIKQYFEDKMTTHYDGCYSMGAEFEDRQEIMQAIMNPEQRMNYLLSDNGPRDGGNKCKCTNCNRDFADMPEDAELGNRFAVIRAKSWWQFFTMNQNTDIVNYETRDEIWAFDEQFQYSGPYVLKSNEFFLDPVRYENMTDVERQDLEKFVKTQYGGELQEVGGNTEQEDEKTTECANFLTTFIVLPAPQEGTDRAAIIQRNKDFRRDLFKQRSSEGGKFKIFTITYEDLGPPMTGGVNTAYVPKIQYLKPVARDSTKMSSPERTTVQDLKRPRKRGPPSFLGSISGGTKKRKPLEGITNNKASKNKAPIPVRSKQKQLMNRLDQPQNLMTEEKEEKEENPAENGTADEEPAKKIINESLQMGHGAEEPSKKTEEPSEEPEEPEKGSKKRFREARNYFKDLTKDC